MHHGKEEFNHRNAQVVHTTIKYELHTIINKSRRKSLMIILTEAERTLSKIKLSFY